jgi:superoxide reductase
MTKLNQVYRCQVCGNIVEVLHTGKGQLVRCGQPMQLLEANTVDAAKEKHVPILDIGADEITVRVGSEAHPMTAEHYLEWIELLVDGRVYRQYLQPPAQPQATFCVTGKSISARTYCNLHGLWKNA